MESIVQKPITGKRRKFIMNIAKGLNKQESAILAGYNPKNASAISNQLLKNTSIIEALNKVGLNDIVLAQGIKTNVEAGMGIKATADTSLKGIELALKLKGHLEREQPENMTQNNIYINELKQMSDTELALKLDELTQEVAKLK